MPYVAYIWSPATSLLGGHLIMLSPTLALQSTDKRPCDDPVPSSMFLHEFSAHLTHYLSARRH